MLSQNVARSTVPSYYMIRTNLPHRKPQNQWEGVYYFSGITRRQQHVMLMQRKYQRMAVLQHYHTRRATLEQQWEVTMKQMLEAHRPNGLSSSSTLAAKEGRLEASFRLSCQLAHAGLHNEAYQLLGTLPTSTAEGCAFSLQPSHYITFLQSLQAGGLGAMLLTAEASGDPALVYKLLGDHGGVERSSIATEVFETGLASLSRPTSTIASQLMNSLMDVSLTCGYSHVKAVPQALYDRMGGLGIAPTSSTYDAVLTALALMGDMKEAEHVHRFVRSHSNTANNIRSEDAMLLGYREAKAFDQCDRIWGELVDRRWPRAAVSTAELYLRSIVDESVTPVSEPLQRFGEINVVAKKKIPRVLAEMEQLGIPRVQLSRPLQDEVEDALRKFSIYKEKFYEWGRAVKQFDFIEFRRRCGWMYDLHAMKNTTAMMPPVRDPTQPDATLVGAAMAELPAFFNEKFQWERDALEEHLYIEHEKERSDDVRSGDIYHTERTPVHQRSSTWMSEVPETRYDQLYGISHPDVGKVGIRRHLHVEYVNRAEVMQRDAAIVRKSLSRGRRMRHRTEVFRTHRSEAARAGGASSK